MSLASEIHAEIATLKTDRDSWRRVCERLETELARLRSALKESVKLQSHYAALLNEYDGGERFAFKTADEWVARLAALASPQGDDGARGEAPIYTGAKPTIHELEDILERQGQDAIAINPDGSITTVPAPSPSPEAASPYWTCTNPEQPCRCSGLTNPRCLYAKPKLSAAERADAEECIYGKAAPPIGETLGPAHDKIWAEHHSSEAATCPCTCLIGGECDTLCPNHNSKAQQRAEAAPPSADDMAQARELITRWNKVWQSGEDIDFSLQQEIATAIRAARQAGLREAEQWHLSQRPKLSGPEYGFASEAERRALRDLDRFHVNCASAIRALAPTPEPSR